MAVSFKFFPEYGLTYFNCSSFMFADDVVKILNEYLDHESRFPPKKKLVDLSGIAAAEGDYANVEKINAMKDKLFPESLNPLIVYFAPTELSQRISAWLVQAWGPKVAANSYVETTQDAVMQRLMIKDDAIVELISQTT